MILTTIADLSYIHTTWNNASHLTSRRLIFLFITLGLTYSICGPTFYITIVNTVVRAGYVLVLILSSNSSYRTSQRFSSKFSIMPSGRMLFGDRVWRASQESTSLVKPSPPVICRDKQNRIDSILLWILVFSPRIQVHRIVFLPHHVVRKACTGHGWDERMYGSVRLECPLHEPGGVYADDHVRHEFGSGSFIIIDSSSRHGGWWSPQPSRTAFLHLSA